MRQDIIGRTISWSLGFALPMLFLVMGVLSIVLEQSAVPLSRGFGRFAIGATEATGERAVIMGFAYIGFAALLMGSLFYPLRARHGGIATLMQAGGFLLCFVLFAYVLLFSRG